MKNHKIITGIATLFVVLLTSGFVSAGKPLPGTSEALRKILTDHVSYPDFAKETLASGFVVVSLEVLENGKLNIKAINASEPGFQQHFTADLAEVSVDNASAYAGKTFYYRFDFVMQNYG
jgi:hypothetical protein